MSIQFNSSCGFFEFPPNIHTEYRLCLTEDNIIEYLANFHTISKKYIFSNELNNEMFYSSDLNFTIFFLCTKNFKKSKIEKCNSSESR